MITNNTWASLRGETRNLFILPFIIPHVHMSFPLNHIFQDHSSYSIEYKLYNYECVNIIIQILLPLGHIYNNQGFYGPECNFYYSWCSLCYLDSWWIDRKFFPQRKHTLYVALAEERFMSMCIISIYNVLLTSTVLFYW